MNPRPNGGLESLGTQECRLFANPIEAGKTGNRNKKKLVF